MAVMVVTTVCGAMIGYYLLDGVGTARGQMHADWILFARLVGGAIGAVVGVPIWGLLGYMVYRKKNAAPNEIIPDDSTT